MPLLHALQFGDYYGDYDDYNSYGDYNKDDYGKYYDQDKGWGDDGENFDNSWGSDGRLDYGYGDDDYWDDWEEWNVGDGSWEREPEGNDDYGDDDQGDYDNYYQWWGNGGRNFDEWGSAGSLDYEYGDGDWDDREEWNVGDRSWEKEPEGEDGSKIPEKDNGYSCSESESKLMIVMRYDSKAPFSECGRVKYGSRIVGGTEAGVNEFPWQVRADRVSKT